MRITLEIVDKIIKKTRINKNFSAIIDAWKYFQKILL